MGQQAVPSQSLSNVGVHQSREAGPVGRAAGLLRPAVLRSSTLPRAVGAVAQATRGKPQQREILWAAFHGAQVFVLFLRICSICLFLNSFMPSPVGMMVLLGPTFC